MKASIAALGLSNGARVGLTGFVAGLARELAPTGVTVNNLLPGHFETERLRRVTAAQAQKEGRPFEEVWARQLQDNPMRRIGRPEEFGAACAFLCGAQAGYMTGQNILLDGGAYPGTL